MYDYAYFIKNKSSREHRFWEQGEIRYGDQLAAIGYAFGLESYLEVKNVVGFQDGEEPLGYDVKTVLDKLYVSGSREPGKTLDIGGGRGEISLGLSYLDVDVTMLDPTEDVSKLLKETAKKLDIEDRFEVLNGPLGNLREFDYETVIFCESIEHIAKPELQHFFSNYEGRVIITNFIDYHPIEIDKPWHITRIDNDFYDSIKGEVIYREGSHLVIDV